LVSQLELDDLGSDARKPRAARLLLLQGRSNRQDVRDDTLGRPRDSMLKYPRRANTSMAYTFTKPPLLFRTSTTTPCLAWLSASRSR